MNPFAEREWRLAHGRSLTLGPVGRLMGILNVTPDSFSDGGTFIDIAEAVDAALHMVEEGASIIDIGGESTRPGAAPVVSDEEMERVIPIVEAVAKRSDTLMSIDTSKADVADAALLAGAHAINDVTGLKGDPAMASAVQRHGAGLVAMHNSREEFSPSRREDPIEEQREFLDELLALLEAEKIARTQVVVDPGIGFGKDARENLELLSRLEELTSGPLPVLLGTSRKRFIGSVTGREPSMRDVGTAITTAFGRRGGIAIFRVHDVPANRDALRMTEAIMNAGESR